MREFAKTLSGSSGQADTGTLAGDSYRLEGSFWSGAATRSVLFLPLVQR